MSATPQSSTELDDGRLSIEVKEHPAQNLVQVSLKGRVDVFTYKSLGDQVAAIYNERPELRLVLDLSGVAFVASSGWATFLTIRSRLARLNGKLVLAGLSGELQKVYDALNLEPMLPRYADARQASEALSRG